MVGGGAIAGLSYIVVCAATFAELRREVARSRRPRQSFPPTAFMIGLYGGTLAMVAVLVVGTHHEGDPIGIQVLPLAFVVIVFCGWPRTIHVDEKGMWQRTRFGAKKWLPFDEVVAVSYVEGTTVVMGKNTTLEHTQYHAGADRFQRVLWKRCGKRIY